MNQTGLHIAAKNNNRALASYLIANNAYIDAVDYLNRTPLFIAASRNYYQLAIVHSIIINRDYFPMGQILLFHPIKV